MSLSQFKVISWNPNDPITDEQLDAMVSNTNILRQNMVTGNYGAFNKNRDEGIRVATGLALITGRKAANASVAVSFGGFFTPKCRPIVTTGIVSKAQRSIFCVIDGPGTELHPTRDGFQVHVQIYATAKKDLKIKRNFYVSWVAVGY